MRKVLLGIDGAPFSMLNELIADGKMPNLAKLSETGTFRPLQASLPENSAVSWSSIMTGTNPGEHGIFGFTDIIPNTYTMRFPNFYNIKVPTYWQQEPDKRHIIINLPFTYPVKEINGHIVSGFVSPDLKRAVYPVARLKKLKDIGYRIDPDTKKIYQSKELFMEDLFKTHSIRSAYYRELFEEEHWDMFTIIFTGTDRLGHYFIDDYNNKDSKYHDSFVEYFTKIDEEIGWVVQRLNSEDCLVMVSDHGMDEVYKEVNLNKYLADNGFLELTEGAKNYNAVTEQTVAFAMEPARIMFNLEGRYPKGRVKETDRDKIAAELTELFNKLEYEGRKVVKQIFRKEELYTGDETANAPDMILIPEKGFSFRGVIGKDELFSDPDIIKGMHTVYDAFIYANVPADSGIVPEKPKAEDILKIFEKMEKNK